MRIKYFTFEAQQLSFKAESNFNDKRHAISSKISILVGVAE